MDPKVEAALALNRLRAASEKRVWYSLREKDYAAVRAEMERLTKLVETQRANLDAHADEERARKEHVAKVEGERDAALAREKALREALLKCEEQFAGIRDDWTDPRGMIRIGREAIANVLAAYPEKEEPVTEPEGGDPTEPGRRESARVSVAPGAEHGSKAPGWTDQNPTPSPAGLKGDGEDERTVGTPAENEISTRAPEHGHDHRTDAVGGIPELTPQLCRILHNTADSFDGGIEVHGT